MKFTAEQISDIEAFILNGRPHTLRSASIYAGVVNHVQERQIDKIIQRLRKRGSIVRERIGRDQFWTAKSSQAAKVV